MESVRSILLLTLLCGSTSLGLPRRVSAQGPTTSSISGAVHIEGGGSADGARVRVLNTVTGFSWNTRVARGRFNFLGLEVGGPYTVEVHLIGFQPQRSPPLTLSLGEPLEFPFTLPRAPTQLDAIVVNAEMRRTDLGTTIRDSLLQRLPTLNRNFYDFVPLAPQVSTKVGFQRGGMSAAGANLRFNGFLINGADERFVNGSVSPGFGGGKSIPIDAVKEYQVLVAPFNVRYGDFAGGLVNTVTQSGTNEFHGSAFTFWRNDGLARSGSPASATPYDRWQYGFSFGGPILRDRLHFFVASELQRFTSPARGPYLGQPTGATLPIRVSESDVTRFQTLMRGYGLTPGSAGFVELETPLRNLFARVDAAIPRWNSRVIGFVSDAGGATNVLERSPHDFPLSSMKQTSESGLRLASLQLHTDFDGWTGAHNELLVSGSIDGGQPKKNPQPLIRVSVPGDDGFPVSLAAGTVEGQQGRFRRSRAITAKDELSLPWGTRNLLTIGAVAERFRIQTTGVIGGYGTWTFPSLDAFAQGAAERYTVRKDFGSASRPFVGGQYGAFVGDELRVSDRVSITLGLRADALRIDDTAPYNRDIDSIFSRRTDEMPKPRIQLSPRLGFAWDLFGDGRDKLRGGVGIFTGRPPLAWIQPALSSYGVGIGTLNCGASYPNPAPAFPRDYRDPPTACATGSELTAKPNGDVDLLDRNLKMAQALRASLAYERRLPRGIVGTGELTATRYISDFMFSNLNLSGPQAVDRFGRVMYGTIGADSSGKRSNFSEVIELKNTSGNYSYQLSARVEKQFTHGVDASVAYTYSRVREIQSPSRVNSPGIQMWGDASAVSGRHDNQGVGVGLNDLPHRVVAKVVYTAPWARWSTGFSFYYVGEAGSPFTYLAWGASGRGDLNADGSSINDPIYVPRDVADTNEIRFSPTVTNSLAAQDSSVRAQQLAFQSFIDGSPCLRRQRGHILERNSCREPWSHTTIASIVQTIPVASRGVQAELDVFNVLNLLNGAWGHYRVADAANGISNPQLLEHVGQTPGSAATSQPVFRFVTTRPMWKTLQTESAFQLQLALRYRF